MKRVRRVQVENGGRLLFREGEVLDLFKVGIEIEIFIKVGVVQGYIFSEIMCQEKKKKYLGIER